MKNAPTRNLIPAANVTAVGVLLALSAVSGCAKNLNSERTVGTGDRQFNAPTVSQSAPKAEAVDQSAYPQATVSLISLDRDNWQPTRVSVPNAMPAHQPIYHGESFSNTTIERTRGRFPTYDSATTLTDSDSADAQVTEAFLAPFMAAGDILLWPARAVYKRPWFVTRGGLMGGRYDRMNAEGTYNAAEPIGEPRFPMAMTAAPTAAPAPGVKPAVGAVSPMGSAAPVAPAPPTAPAPTPAPTPAPARVPAPAAEPEGRPAGHIGVSDPLGPKN